MSLPNLKTAVAVSPDGTRILTGISSDLKSASAVILGEPGLLIGLSINTDGTNDAQAILYDNASSASGSVLAKCFISAATGNSTILFPVPIRADNGIYLAHTGTGATAVIWYTA